MGISYQDYYQGGVYLNNLIVHRPWLKGFRFIRVFTWWSIMIGILFGSLLAVIVNTCFTAIVAKIFGMDFFPSHFSLSQVSDNRHGSGNHRKLQGLTTVTLGRRSDWDFDQCDRTNLLKWLKIDDPVAVGLSLENGTRCRNRNSLSLRFCSRSHGWLGYRYYWYSLTYL